jgi:hypothetical protein
MQEEKRCSRCSMVYPLTIEYFYVARPHGKHKSSGWQSHCKNCWKSINKENKLRMKKKGS